jgi:large subunit ribosomal protein L21e
LIASGSYIKLRPASIGNKMPSSHGFRRKSRAVMTQNNVPKGLSYLLADYNPGDKVIIVIDPREHKTTPHRRYHGKVGTVLQVGRRTLKTSVVIGNKQKILQTRLNHIKHLAAVN